MLRLYECCRALNVKRCDRKVAVRCRGQSLGWRPAADCAGGTEAVARLAAAARAPRCGASAPRGSIPPAPTTETPTTPTPHAHTRSHTPTHAHTACCSLLLRALIFWVPIHSYLLVKCKLKLWDNIYSNLTTSLLANWIRTRCFFFSS